jgi:hypothetical protein
MSQSDDETESNASYATNVSRASRASQVPEGFIIKRKTGKRVKVTTEPLDNAQSSSPPPAQELKPGPLNPAPWGYTKRGNPKKAPRKQLSPKSQAARNANLAKGREKRAAMLAADKGEVVKGHYRPADPEVSYAPSVSTDNYSDGSDDTQDTQEAYEIIMQKKTKKEKVKEAKIKRDAIYYDQETGYSSNHPLSSANPKLSAEEKRLAAKETRELLALIRNLNMVKKAPVKRSQTIHKHIVQTLPVDGYGGKGEIPIEAKAVAKNISKIIYPQAITPHFKKEGPESDAFKSMLDKY